MKRILLILILIIPFFIQACNTGRWDYINEKDIIVQPGGYEKNYELGAKQTAFIGKEIIHAKEFEESTQSAIFLDKVTIEFSTKIINFGKMELSLDKNREYTLRETIKLGETYYLLTLPYPEWKLLISTDGKIYNKSLIRDGYVYTPDKGISIEPNNYKLLLTEKFVEPLYSFDLIYSGINDVSLNTTYREYTKKNMARPSFFQVLTYNADARTIRFKDFLIQIHDVTNEKITYTILEDGLEQK